MNKIIFIFLLFLFTNLNSLPGKLICYDQITQIPIVDINFLDIKDYKILSELNSENLPNTANWQQYPEYHINRNRKVYLTKDQKFVIKIWQKNYPSTINFLLALYAGFYKEITIISGLIFDNEECRGYITPYMTDRTYNRNNWESFGFKLEKGTIGVKIFSNYELQPQIYKNFFDKLINNTKQTKFVSLDFCPDNVAINPEDNNLYLIDLEDVQPIEMLKNDFITQIYFPYNPSDYLKKIAEF